jgi:hypothetical protein
MNNIKFHPKLRNVNKEIQLDINELSQVGIAPRNILSILRQKYPTKEILSKDIYNVNYLNQQNSLNGKSYVNILLDSLSKGPYKVIIDYDSNNNIVRLFYSHIISIELAKLHSNIFIIDCIYQSNKYSLPLLNIIGITSTYHNFNAGFIFLQREKEEDFKWAMTAFKLFISSPNIIVVDRDYALINAIKVVYPNTHIQLCCWHVEYGLRKNIKKFFPNSISDPLQEDWNNFLNDWNGILNTKNTNDLNYYYNLFKIKYTSYNKSIIDYIDSV